MADRPSSLVLVAGTGTGVGKTWVAASWARRARRGGRRVAARKPAQSFDPGTGPTDAELLAAATGEAPSTVCRDSRSYEIAMAPFMAAAALGRPEFSLADLLDELTWPAGIDLGLVEPAGGVRSPMTSDGADTLDLADALQPDHVLLVADSGLGTINVVRLCLDVLPTRTILFLNRYDDTDDVHRANRAWLELHTAGPVVTTIDELPG